MSYAFRIGPDPVDDPRFDNRTYRLAWEARERARAVNYIRRLVSSFPRVDEFDEVINIESLDGHDSDGLILNLDNGNTIRLDLETYPTE